MQDGRAHPYLAQIPLTVSPFVSLPTATTLPYTYKSLPSALPPNSTGESKETPKPKFVVSHSGHNAHPDEIIASCQALQQQLQMMQQESEATLKKWQDDIKERELAEKRRVAPGWLDRDEKILQPQRKNQSTPGAASGVGSDNIMDMQDVGPVGGSLIQERAAEGEALDRAFGSMDLR